jgi:hypothetical protein
MKTGIFLISKNNYEMLENVWIPNMDYNGFEVVNIDEGSTEEQIALGKKICKDNNILFMERDRKGLHSKVEQCCKYFKEKGIKYLIWFQHDCWFLKKDSLKDFNEMVTNGVLDDYGAVGFNGLATDVVANRDADIESITKGKSPLGVMARNPLQNRVWLVGTKGAKFKPIDPNKYKNPFAIESVAWFAIAINIDKYFETIKPDYNYDFHIAWDDVCYQFLKNNVYNIVLPKIYIEHRPDLKIQYNLPHNSAKYTRNKENNKFFENNIDHMEYWKQKWGFSWGDLAHKEFKSVKQRYENTLLLDFYTHNPDNGPLKEFIL